MDYSLIDKKWNEKWATEKAFEVNPETVKIGKTENKKNKKYITAAFPYPNSPQHIGHARTYTTADIYARYLRLRGYNVLFPMAFHVTGTPILAMAKRIGAKDNEVLDVFENIYGISEETSKTLSDPRELVSYFSKEIEQGMKEIGYSIDWRRKFYSYDEKFSKFIQWQFMKLKEKNYVIKGEYPIAWCPSDKNAVSAHDTRGDVDPEIEEVVVVKFPIVGKTNEFLVTTTYRPETIYGVTNIWINPEISYVKAGYKGKQETVYLSEKAAEMLSLQLQLKVVGKIGAEELLKLTVQNPITKENVPVWKASFVKPDIGTGIVMSVPAHAPLDYLAIRDMGNAETVKMPQVVATKGYGSVPAKEVVEQFKVKDQRDPISESATKEIYTKEAHEGVMLVGEYKGQQTGIAKEKIANDMKESNQALDIVTLTNGPVYCRCGTRVVVNILRDQWFIDYGIPSWKEKAKECLKQMEIIPEKGRQEYEYTIDWLMTRPCTRASGLGTKFPFDETKMIEALSDSTLYMAFYTFAHLLDQFEPSDLDEEFFDYVILGKAAKSEKARKREKRLRELRDSFLYWYPCDSRHSAGDLIRNHLTLYLFIHSGLLPKELWPKQIVTNGFVLMDGKKMSKSMGNILPLRKAIAEYGADVVRFSVVSGAELSTDTDFSKSVAEGVKSRMAFLSSLVEAAGKQGKKTHSRIDLWLLSRLNRKIANAEKLYEKLAIRDLAMEIFYDMTNDLQWYLKRTEGQHNHEQTNLHDFFEKWVVLVAPFMPHYAEEYWEILGKKKMVCYEEFPKPDESKIDDALENGEELITQVHTDIEKISKIIGKKPASIKIFVASEWKRRLFEIARREKAFDKTMKVAGAEKLPMQEAAKIVQGLMKSVHSLPPTVSQKDELDSLQDGKTLLAKEFGCSVEVLTEENGNHPKTKSALPNKPAILIE
ncbi:leucine--tRNA ligase [Candidatus Micrarchaeota archaeon]|nr:leucine--tRNA ligase [Candidatus Micrarchaeota archaeon]